jgi:hypothetical protein
LNSMRSRSSWRVSGPGVLKSGLPEFPMKNGPEVLRQEFSGSKEPFEGCPREIGRIAIIYNHWGSVWLYRAHLANLVITFHDIVLVDTNSINPEVDQSRIWRRADSRFAVIAR